MKVTLVQSTVKLGKEENLNHINNLLQEPFETDMIILSEMFISPYENSFFLNHSVTEDDIFFDVISEISKRFKCIVVAGSVPEKREGKLFNTTFVFDNGNLVTKYSKIHLFEITYPNGETYKESDILKAGEDIITFDTTFGKVGLMICFDIRFPDLAKELRKKGAELIVVPAAFNTYTGPLHWELTFRSRAVDNQLFTIGASPSSHSYGNYNYYGHSIVVDPLGKVLYQASKDEEIKTIEINLKLVEETRRSLPIIKNEKELNI